MWRGEQSLVINPLRLLRHAVDAKVQDEGQSCARHRAFHVLKLNKR